MSLPHPPLDMVLRTFDGTAPTVHETAYVDDLAAVVGDVVLGENASVWPNATLRGDDGAVRVGAETSVQDNAVLHEGPTVGERVTVGHGAIVHGCEVGDRTLVGMGSVLLTGAEVGERCVVAAGAVVREGQTVPPETLVAGVPAEAVRDLSEVDRPEREGKSYYAQLAEKHRETARVLDRADLE